MNDTVYFKFVEVVITNKLVERSVFHSLMFFQFMLVLLNKAEQFW